MVVEDQGHYSDTTASAPGSDDEGSLGGDEGETGGEAGGGESEGGAAGSDSGGSVGESIGVENLTVSGRSSTYGMMETAVGECQGDQQQREGAEGQEADLESDSDARLRSLRLVLLEQLVNSIGEIREVGGAQCIPYTQLVLAVAADLDHADERDRAAVDCLLKRLIQELGVGADIPDDSPSCAERSAAREFQLVILRLLSVLMSRSRSPPARQPVSQEAANFVSKTTAAMLAESGTVGYCLTVLKNIIGYWQVVSAYSTRSITIL